MSNIIFNLGGSVCTIASGATTVYPVDNPVQVNVVLGYSEGKYVYAYNKGIKEKFYNVILEALTDSDDASLLHFFGYVCYGPAYPFTYTDEDGNSHTVRWMDKIYPIREVSAGRHSGTIALREEQYY